MKSYDITDCIIVTNHNPFMESKSELVCEGRHRNSRHLDIDASVKSGEYFLTLATILDNISDHPELQQITRDLLYLQRYYKIIRR